MGMIIIMLIITMIILHKKTISELGNYYPVSTIPDAQTSIKPLSLTNKTL